MDVPRALLTALLQVTGALFIGLIAARVVSRSRTPRLPNERITIPDEQRPALGGWLFALAGALVAAPLVLVFRLQSFLAEWREVLGYLTAPGFWDNANANGSGLVLLPMAGALTPPFLQLVTLITFCGVSATLLTLLVRRSPRFPRASIAAVVLLTGLVLASARATSAALMVGDSLRGEIARTSVNAEEAATLNAALDRYVNAVRTASPALMWSWLAYALWIPALFASGRVRTTFAGRVEPPARQLESPADVAAITRPPRTPGF